MNKFQQEAIQHDQVHIAQVLAKAYLTSLSCEEIPYAGSQDATAQAR